MINVNQRAVVHHIPITRARINLGQLARRVQVNKEYFILEKDGIPAIGIVDEDELEDYLEVRDPAVNAHTRKATRSTWLEKVVRSRSSWAN